jgi:DNA-directed RNA polymerase specialized sigma24 family protein
MMKYDPRKKLNENSSEWEILMMPFAYENEVSETNWKTVDIVTECLSTLNEEDQRVLYEIFYDRTTYEELAKNLNIKAKSHAWRKTKRAMERLKEKIMEHPDMQHLKDK